MTPLNRAQFLCFVLVWFSYASTYLLRKPLGVVKADLGADLGVGKMELGWCDTALVLPYAAIQILYPGIADRYGPKRVLVCCLALAGLTTLATYSAPSLFFFMVGLVATGALLAPCWPACTKILGLWFQDSRLNSVFGLINTATYSGGVGGTALAATLVSHSGWRSVATPPAVVAFATALCLACLLSTPRERGLSVPGKEPLLPQEKVSPSTSAPLSALIHLPCVPELSAAMFCLKLVRYALYMWLPLYLVEHLGYPTLQAGLASTVFDIGGILGSPLLGLALDKTATAPLPCVGLVILVGAGALVVFLLTSGLGVGANLLCLFLVGAANCGPDSIIAGSISMDVGERAGGGQGAGVTSLVNGVGNLGGMVEGPMIGALYNLSGWTGVLPSLVAFSALGSLLIYRAAKIQNSMSSNLPL